MRESARILRISALVAGVLLLCGRSAHLAASPLAPGPTAAPAGWSSSHESSSADSIPPFSHQIHKNLACTSCHNMSQVHGGILVKSVEDCRSCHHTSRSGRVCTQCHDVSTLEGRVFALKRTFSPSVEPEPSVRELPFRHEPHRSLQCTQCHTDGPDLAIPDLDCTGCHQKHHSVDASCFDCHREPRQGAHTRQVHVTCTGSGCHESVPVDGPPRTRTGCLWCHQNQTDHMVGQECVDCHVMPPARSAAAVTGASP